MNKLQLILANKHTTGAAILYALAKCGALMGAIWVPAHKDQFQQTAEALEALAISWGLVMAGDANPVNGGVPGPAPTLPPPAPPAPAP